MNAAMVQKEACAASQPRDGGSTPTSPLHSLIVKPINIIIAKQLVEREHYLHSLPGGTKLAFGVFTGKQLVGAATFGVGPYLAYQLVEGATPDDCLTLTRLWLSDALPVNSESRVIGIILRALRNNTAIKFIISYADPSKGHLGTIYQATGWIYTGLSEAMPLYDLGDGTIRHSRSLAHAYGTHSVRYFAGHGLSVKLIRQVPKYRYVYFLDPEWRSGLKVAVLPYPKKEAVNAGN